MKKAFVIIGICLVAGYLIFAALYFPEKPQEGICSQFEIEIKDAGATGHFVDPEDIEKNIATQKLNPKGKTLKEVDIEAIKTAILASQLVKSADVYITNSGNIKAVVEERKPVLRVINTTGESYYVDDEGNKMPLSKRYTAYLPMATGGVKEEFAKNELYQFALFVGQNEFWNAQIEQIVVYGNNEIKLIPRVGDQEIILGSLNGYQDKLEKLMVFYDKGLNETGWNKYSVINLKFDKQVVCTKR